MDLREKEGMNVESCTLQEFLYDFQTAVELMELEDSVLAQYDLSLEQVRTPLLVIGEPGVGKTAGIKSIIDAHNANPDSKQKFGFKIIRLGQKIVGDLDGLPVYDGMAGEVRRMPMEDLPQVERDGEYGVLFLDELTSADVQQIQPALGLADSTRTIGTYRLPEHWLLVAAGNGDNCSNFVRLDDMTISRFAVYDVITNYETDWRPWAHANKIEADILAYLNFRPDSFCKVISTDMDKTGKQFTSARTWTTLDAEIKKRKLRAAMLNKPMTDQDLKRICNACIGSEVTRDFLAFLTYRSKLKYDPDKILKGIEEAPAEMEKQSFHIILESCVKKLLEVRQKNPATFTTQLANLVTWLLQSPELDNKLSALTELRNPTEEINNEKTGLAAVNLMASDPTFLSLCPSLDDFIITHSEFFMNNADII